MSDTQKRPEKIAIFREATELLKGRPFAFLVNFGGLTVVQIADIRSQLAAKNLRFAVIKNSIIGKIAAEQGWADLSELLSGPTAVVVGEGDIADIAKTLVDFTKKNDKSSVKGGQLDSKLLTADDVLKLSELISLAAQQARLLGTLQAPASQMARVLQAKIDAAPAAEAPAPAAEAPAAVVETSAEVAPAEAAAPAAEAPAPAAE